MHSPNSNPLYSHQQVNEWIQTENEVSSVPFLYGPGHPWYIYYMVNIYNGYIYGLYI